MEKWGKYIVIEGGDGTGKTTAANGVARVLREKGHEVIRVDEPDSARSHSGEELVPIASEIRKILKNGNLQRSPLTNVLLFHTQRLENWQQAILPALPSGVDVVASRNYWSTLAYQGSEEGIDTDWIIELTKRDLGEKYMKPDYGFILQTPIEEQLKRISSRGELENPDTFESKGMNFQEKVAKKYNSIAEEYALEVVDSTKSQEEVLNTILARLAFLN